MAFKTMITRLHPLRSLRVETPGEMHLHVDWVLLNPELRCSLCVLIKCNSLETQLNTSILYSIFFSDLRRVVRVHRAPGKVSPHRD